MRKKKNSQPEFHFQLPSSAKVTREYFAAYDAISRTLDEHSEIVERVHRDLRKPLAKARRRGPQGHERIHAPDFSASLPPCRYVCPKSASWDRNSLPGSQTA